MIIKQSFNLPTHRLRINTNGRRHLRGPSVPQRVAKGFVHVQRDVYGQMTKHPPAMRRVERKLLVNHARLRTVPRIGTLLIGHHAPNRVAMGYKHVKLSAVRRSTLQIMDQAQAVLLIRNPVFLRKFNIVTASIARLTGILRRGYQK